MATEPEIDAPDPLPYDRVKLVAATSETPLADVPRAPADKRLRLAFALTGIVPLGAFVPVHLLTTATATLGAARFDRTFARSPVVTALLLVFVVAPLAFHGAYGAWLALKRPETARLPGWLPRVRATASLVTLAFVVGHVLELPARGWTGALRASSLFDVTSAHLSTTWLGVPWVALAYLVGVTATIAHFSLALWAFVPTAGLILSDSGRRFLAWGMALGAAALFLVAANTILYFATGSRLFGSPPADALPDGPPPVPCSPKT